MNSERHHAVSIGMPVYNGAEVIRSAIDSLLAQKFSDFELIISDNASTDMTGEICQSYEKRDSRIKYIRQETNIGILQNFDFVLKEATGTFFMWAAHDDTWDANFLDTLMSEFASCNSEVIAVGCEAQYTVNNCKQPFFPEGQPFYEVFVGSAEARLYHMLENAYGNLFYSLFKRDHLLRENSTVLSRISRVSLNEIPVFVQLASQGSWKIVPRPLFFKENTALTYLQAKWEMEGGVLPFGGTRHFLAGIVYGTKYHIQTLVDMVRTVAILDMRATTKINLVACSVFQLLVHYCQCLVHYKKKRRRHRSEKNHA